MLKKDNKTKYSYVASYISDDGSADSLSFESTPEEVHLNFFKAYCDERGIDFDITEMPEFENNYLIGDRVYTVVNQVAEGAGSQAIEEAIQMEIERCQASLVTLDRVNALIDAVSESSDTDEYKEIAVLQILMERFNKRTNSEDYPDNIMNHKDVICNALADLDPQETWEGMFYDLGRIRAYKEILRMLGRKK